MRLAVDCANGAAYKVAPAVLEGRWLPALTVTTDRPSVACLASQYAGWRIDRDGYFFEPTVFRGVTDDHWDAIESVLERHGLALVLERDGDVELVGVLER